MKRLKIRINKFNETFRKKKCHPMAKFLLGLLFFAFLIGCCYVVYEIDKQRPSCANEMTGKSCESKRLGNPHLIQEINTTLKN